MLGSLPYAFHIFDGAGNVIFSNAAKCTGLTGVTPKSGATILLQAKYLANLLVPV